MGREGRFIVLLAPCLRMHIIICIYHRNINTCFNYGRSYGFSHKTVRYTDGSLMLAVNSFTPKSVKCFSLKEEVLISQLSKIPARLLLILSSLCDLLSIFYLLNVSRRMDKKRNISLMTYVEM